MSLFTRTFGGQFLNFSIEKLTMTIQNISFTGKFISLRIIFCTFIKHKEAYVLASVSMFIFREPRSLKIIMSQKRETIIMSLKRKKIIMSFKREIHKLTKYQKLYTNSFSTSSIDLAYTYFV